VATVRQIEVWGLWCLTPLSDIPPHNKLDINLLCEVQELVKSEIVCEMYARCGILKAIKH
jgi:hypothetical protein